MKPWDAEAGQVEAGRVASWFGQPGGGVQLKTEKSVEWLLETGYVREIKG